MKNVQILRGRYYARIGVPEELREIVGKRELRQPLGSDKLSAQRNAHAVLAQFHAELDKAHATIMAGKPTLRTAALKHYSEELKADDRSRGAVGSRSIAELNAWSAPQLALRLRLLVDGEVSDEEAEALMGYAADSLIASGHGSGAPGRPERRALLRVLAESHLDVMAAFEARDGGRVTVPAPKSSLLQVEDDEGETAMPSPGHRAAATGATLVEILTEFHRERTAGVRSLAKKTMDEHKVAVRMLDEFLGSTRPARAITRADMLAYKAALLQTPSRYALRFPGLSLPQAIVANKGRSTPFATLAPQTINMKWLSHISTIMKWGMNNGHLEDNSSSGVKVDEGKGFREPSRVPFSADDLKAMFGTDLFKHPKRYQTQQWALLLALFTGARSSSEIARVNLSDIRQEQGIWIIELSEASKNTRSKRIVPIHQALIDLGLLAYVERLRKQGESRLFFDWQPEDKINRWFLRIYKKQVGINDSRKVFHSFRNTMKTALARYGVNRDVSDLITGHKDQSVAAVYIDDAAVTMIEAMNKGLNRVRFDLPMLQTAL